MTRPPSPTLSQLPPIPASPTYSYASMSTTAAPTTPASTINMSSYNLPLPPPPPPTPHAVLTKSDLAASQTAYATLLTTAKSYRLALAALSTAASAFGAALESCARLKEARADSLAHHHTTTTSHHHHHHHHTTSSSSAVAVGPTASSGCTADALLAAAGVQHLVANHEQILSETVYRSFEVPLLHELDKWRSAVDDEDSGYRAAVAARSSDIRRLERDGLKLHRQRGPRDIAKFRGHLVELTTRLDGLTALHAEHSRTLLRESQDTSVRILDASCSLVRAEVDIFESLARKGWSGGGLDDILEKGQDLFAADAGAGAFGGVGGMDDVNGCGGGGGGGGGGSTTTLFSILPPKSILADTGIDSSDITMRGRSPHAHHRAAAALGHRRADSLGVSSEPAYQSLSGAVTTTTTTTTTTSPGDGASIFSTADYASPGRPLRNTRPFSPRPMPVAPEDVMGSEGGGGGGGGGEPDDESGSTDSEGPPSSPSTVRDEAPGSGGGGFGDDEHAWDISSDRVSKRVSTAVSDPDERERRWHSETDE
ncbi:unnamed protein product [Discula destructiva]